jgi:hypothetical protein
MQLLTVILISVFLNQAWAWGKRGHEMVGSLAAQLLAKEHPDGKFLIHHSFDMGYYNNVPDLVWKANPKIYKMESTQHYLDLEIFERSFKKKNESSPWIPERKEFFKKFPDIIEKAGRSPWRIYELNLRLQKATQDLKNKKLSKKERQQLQEQWLLTAGILGHYVADLAQPLHVSENHDGQLTGQKGLHHWFEEDIIDELYPFISSDVFKKAQAQWKEFYQTHKDKNAFELSLELAKNSHLALPQVLAIDKKQGRSSASQASTAYRELANERLTLGVLYLAAIWSANLGWTYDGERFFNFVVAPEYIEPAL